MGGPLQPVSCLSDYSCISKWGGRGRQGEEEEELEWGRQGEEEELEWGWQEKPEESRVGRPEELYGGRLGDDGV